LRIRSRSAPSERVIKELPGRAKVGWWDVSKQPEIVAGDAVLDLVRRFLKDFS
jgi:hypothetical protein